MSHYSTAHSGIREFGLGRRLPVGSGRDEAGLVGEHHRLHPGKPCSWQTKMASAWLSVKSRYCTRDQPNLITKPWTRLRPCFLKVPNRLGPGALA